MTASEKIKAQLVASGYVDMPLSKCPKSLLWQPDLIFAKDNYVFLVLIKSNNSIPPAFLDRISKIPVLNVIPLILFGQKLSNNTETEITSLGISIGYFIRGKISNLKIKKKLPKKIIIREIKKKLEVIDIFVSSKQDINEREFIFDRLEYLRKSNSFPFNTPRLIEYHKFSLPKLYKHIKEEMTNCEWIVILLEENFSKVVRYEIKLACRIMRHENIFMFVKSTNTCHTNWEKVLEKIRALKTIKYLPYNDSKDLEVTLTKSVNKRMIEIQKKKHIQIYT